MSRLLILHHGETGFLTRIDMQTGFSTLPDGAADRTVAGPARPVEIRVWPSTSHSLD